LYNTDIRSVTNSHFSFCFHKKQLLKNGSWFSYRLKWSENAHTNFATYYFFFKRFKVWFFVLEYLNWVQERGMNLVPILRFLFELSFSSVGKVGEVDQI